MINYCNYFKKTKMLVKCKECHRDIWVKEDCVMVVCKCGDTIEIKKD